MTTTPARISVNHGGRKQVLPGAADPVREVSRLLRAYTDASDVTVSIKLPDKHGTVLVALEAANAFVGLETADGVYQYVVDEAWGETPSSLSVAGDPYRHRYVLPMLRRSNC
jgi:hypothetical protein